MSPHIFRWRTVMNNYYVVNLAKLPHRGASQRVQEDATRFATVMEALGISFIDAAMTLTAFLPILWSLSLRV